MKRRGEEQHMADGAHPAIGRIVGTVRAIYRYPVKSMRGEPLDTARIGWHGIPGDRRYAFVQAENRSTFPWLTARQIPELLLYTPALEDPTHPSGSPVRVCTPEGAEYAIGSAELHADIARRYPHPFHLLRLGIGAFDDAPLSLITTGTLGALGGALGMELRPLRFRPNLVVETPDGEPFPEERWVGRVLALGDDEDGARLRVTEHDTRCKMITLDPDTAQAEPRVLEEVIRSRDECAGVYCIPARLGAIHVGQSVRLLPDTGA
jgi:MOSC domain-containing protein